MAEMPSDVLPDSSPVGSEPVKTQGQETVLPVVETEAPAPTGSKTPPENLYAALEEERKLRKEAEAKIKELEELTTTDSSEEVYSEEGKALRKQITDLQSRITGIQEEKELEMLRNQYPALKDKSAEFDEFKKDYPRHKLENVAKIFLAEQGLIEQIPQRKGLEKPVAGPKTPTPSGMTAKEIEDLRKSNYKRYLELLTSGKLNPEDIK